MVEKTSADFDVEVYIEDEDLKFDAAGEETSEELENRDITKYVDAVIWSTDWTTETVASQLKKGNIDLNPKFQRRDAWSGIEKSKLIESLLLGFPVPPIILAENKLKKNSYIVIDGKQRLISIRQFYAGVSEKDQSGSDVSDSEFLPLKLSGLQILKDFNGLSYRDISDKHADQLAAFENQTIIAR